MGQNVRRLEGGRRGPVHVTAVDRIRQSYNVLADVRRLLPVTFSRAAAKCVTLGYCPEGEKFSCQKYPTKREAIGG